MYAYLEQFDDRGIDDEEKANVATEMYDALLSVSPGAVSYLGSIPEQIEVMAFAERSSLGRQLRDPIAGDIIYEGSFARDPKATFIEGYNSQKSIVAKLAYVRTLEGLAWTALSDGYTERFVHGARAAFGAIQQDDANHQLIRIMAEQASWALAQQQALEYLDYDDFEEIPEYAWHEGSDTSDAATHELSTLYEDFPGLPRDSESYRVAKNAAVCIEQGVVSSVYLADGKVLSLTRPEKNDGILSREETALLRVMYQPAVRTNLEAELGVSLVDVDLESQVKLLRFMANADKTTYKRLCNSIHNASRPAELAEAFLATEFGDDYGGAILDIAEKVTPEQSKRAFELVQKLRTGSKDFAHMFESIDPNLTESTERALNERITDALIALQEVASRGRLQEDVAPHRKSEGYVHNGDFDITIGSVDEALDIMEGLSNTFNTMHGIIQAPDLSINQVNAEDAQFAVYRLVSDNEGQMLVYVRPEGAYGYDKQVEYGNSKGVEASISFMVDPLDPHRLITPKDSKAVSIRFDHEGRQVGEAPDSARRDPTRRDGLISVDVSSGMGRADLLPVKIGRMIAAGNRIRARRVGSEDSLHHNTNYFDQEKYGDSEGFAWLGRSVIRQIELLKKTLRSRRVGRRATNFGAQADLLKAA